METLSILLVFGLGFGEIFSILFVLFLPLVFFIMAIQKALRQCSQINRSIGPNQVWLLLIPIFNLYWQFKVVSNVGKSLGNEFRSRNIQKENEPGKSIGRVFCFLNVCGFIFTVIECTPIKIGLTEFSWTIARQLDEILGILGLISLICWIGYWITISKFTSELVKSKDKQV